MKKQSAAIAAVLMAAVIGVFGFFAGKFLTEDLTDPNTQHIKLGLDLAGGVSITYKVAGDQTPTEEDFADTQQKLQMRAETYSTEAQVYREGTDRISIEIPGENDADKVLADLGSPGSLYFLSEKDSEGNDNYSYFMSQDGGVVMGITKTIEELEKDGCVLLSGSDVLDAKGGYQQDSLGNNQPVVRLDFTPEGTKKFADATTKAFQNGETIAIYYDGQIISAPSVKAAITTGSAIIEGMGTVEAAENLAAMIRIGGLKVQLEELRSNVVGAQLGQNAISSSLKAGAIGFALVAIFMIAVYLLPGFAAVLALILYVSMIFLVLAGFDITLTLPGIAGILLSVGMAVDANVIIFARIREELRNGTSVKSAIRSGYGKALSSIIDGNVTTLIAAVVLGFLGTGSVRGFAITLGLGIVLSMFTALFVTRFIMNIFYGLGFQDKKFYGLGKDTKTIDFVGNRKKYFAISAAVILAGFIAMGVFASRTGSPLNFSLDFVGGTSTTVTFGETMTLDEIDEKVVPVFEGVTGDANVQVQQIKDSTGAVTSEVVFKTRTLEQEEREDLGNKLADQFGVDKSTILTETISSTISSEMRSDAIVAVLIALACMLVYIWFRFKDIRFGASSVAALVHDVLVVLACYAIVRVPVGGTFIACMLTIVGYSINATIVIFDRMRENLGGRRKADLRALVNTSVTQTLSRSLFTSLTTFFMVLTQYIFGVSSIREFALPIMVGIISGAFSSICIAGPLWYMLRSKSGGDGQILGSEYKAPEEEPDLSEMTKEERKAYEKEKIAKKNRAKVTL